MSKRIYFSICGGILGLALLLLGIYPWFELSINLSNSLPGKLFLIHKNIPVKKGDTIAFYWRGGDNTTPNTIFVKRIAGVAGDIVTRNGAIFAINGQPIGIAKPKSRKGDPLTAAAGGIIEPNSYFVATPSPYSFDSRYTSVGNIRQRDIIGKVYVIF